ncbi:amidase [Agreia bicolorata]|uniref:Amidase n=1 Tax=Agreia bicolorata TaxID=110935 RepID=A0A1T4YBP1_9MICO|nr:amidase [Agreia bicolorata]
MDSLDFTIVEADIDQLRALLELGAVTSVELVARYLNRIAFYDRAGIRLNSVPVINPAAFDEARESDARRALGTALGPLDGMPFTAKDSYRVKGLSVASGSPAFADVIAQTDAFAVARLREAGAVFLGLTNMPPMAAGGMQRGVYGRAESPYSAEYLTSAFGSGSSNGSGTATAASFAAFGLGEETWSSGRAPASNNSLVAYTPSRGVISVRGNWPLVPTMDVVVPHTRSINDIKHVLDAIVVDDPRSDGDLWRIQPWITLPRPSDIRPDSFSALPDLPLEGVRLALPRIYVNGDPGSRYPIETRESIMSLWQHLRDDLEAAGAEVIETSFPAVDNYEKLHEGDRDFVDRGWVSHEFLNDEIGRLSIWALDDFLRQNGDPTLDRLADADASLIFPHPKGALADRYGIVDFDIAYDISDFVARASDGVTDWTQIDTLEQGLRGLEKTRQIDFEQWMAAERFDAVIFPTASDVAPADADVDPASADIAWRNGVWVSNGNLVPRHLGIPTVTVPLGAMTDTRMPVGVTVAVPAYEDARLLQLGSAIAHLRPRRVAPPRTPPLADEALFTSMIAPSASALAVRVDSVEVERFETHTHVRFSATVTAGVANECVAFVDGRSVTTARSGDQIVGARRVDADAYDHPHSEWRPAYGPLVSVVVRGTDGAVAGAVATSAGSPL